MGFIKLLLKKVILISLVFATSIPVIAMDGGKKGSKTKTNKENHIEKNTAGDTGNQVNLKYSGDISSESTNYESEEAMAYRFIEQSIPKTEKITRKEEKEKRKIGLKIIRREKKECKKLLKSIEKNNNYSE
jgi:hypothetical protein